MNIIALEGIDKSGKATQTQLLLEILQKNNFYAAKSEFHRYDSPTGKLIKQFLYEEYDAQQETIELIMAADKYEAQNAFRTIEQFGIQFLILDRYTSSQIAYSEANGMNISWIDELLKFVIKPKLEIFIDIPVSESMSRKGKNPEDDKYEKNRDLLERVRANYIKMFTNSQFNRFTVNGMLPIEQLSDKIWFIVKNFFNL